MKFGVTICIVTDAQGRKGLHISPSVEASQLVKNIIVALLVSIAAAGTLYVVASTPDPTIKPTVTIMGGY
jgi:hypothetical protein